MPETGVEIYETVSSEDENENSQLVEAPNPEICREIVTPDCAIARLSQYDEPVSDRIARIRREIGELKCDARQPLLTELRQALAEADTAITAPQPVIEATPSNSAITADQTNFAELESRIAQLEAKLGSSLASQSLKRPLASKLADLEATVNLLSTDPDLSILRLKKLAKLVPAALDPKNLETSVDSQVEWLYHRLTHLEPSFQQIPAVISRLQTLRFFHARALDTSDQVMAISASLAAMQREVAEWRQVLARLESLVAEK